MSLLVTFGVNGQIASVEVSPWKRLLDVLREDLHLTGTKEGCGEGECGACTVLLDGVPVNSCLVAAGQCDGRAVTTVEGLARGSAAEPLLHAVQRELVARGGAQCGICTPGIAVCAAHLCESGALVGASDPRAKVRELLAGNICRCTGYQLVVDAVIAAALPDGESAADGAGDGGRGDGGAR